jgi:hypothetical protein
MKTIRWMLLSAASLLLVACGGDGVRATSPAPRTHTATAPGPVPTTRAELRVQGDDASGGTLLLKVREAEVTLNGRTLLLQRSRVGVLDLGNTAQAWLLGTFEVPTDAQSVHVRIRFDDYGAFEGLRAGAGWVDARTRAIEFDAPVASLGLRGHAVVHLNLARSLFPTGEGQALLMPVVKVQY